MGHKWSIGDTQDSNLFKFDEMFERYRNESKLPEFFESLIDTLEKMIASDEIDSIKAISSLQQLLSLLNQNKAGSYFSTMASWEFLGGFIKNTFWVSLDSIPVVKQLKKGFEKTIIDMDVELEIVHQSIADEMKSKFGTTISSLSYKKQSDNLIEYDKK